MKALYNAMREVSPDWESFGIQLNIQEFVLKNIPSKSESKSEGNEGYFREMLSTWLKSVGEDEVKTVKKLKEALHRTSHQYVADELLERLNSGRFELVYTLFSS